MRPLLPLSNQAISCKFSAKFILSGFIETNRNWSIDTKYSDRACSHIETQAFSYFIIRLRHIYIRISNQIVQFGLADFQIQKI